MKYWTDLHINNLDIIANKVLKLIEDAGAPDYTHLYYLERFHSDTPDRFKQIPELAEEIKRLGLYDYWEDTAVVIMYDKELLIHVDSGTRYSLNIPIKNTKNTYTVFYKASAKPEKRMMEGNVYYWGLDKQDCVEATRFELVNTAALYNVAEPHNVVLGDSIIPRIVLALRLSNKANDLIDKQF